MILKLVSQNPQLSMESTDLCPFWVKLEEKAVTQSPGSCRYREQKGVSYILPAALALLVVLGKPWKYLHFSETLKKIETLVETHLQVHDWKLELGSNHFFKQFLRLGEPWKGIYGTPLMLLEVATAGKLENPTTITSWMPWKAHCERHVQAAGKTCF